ncbi:lipid II:glycine glycyltransferase FemX, partial [Ruania albidiflava]|uniref:lipid II:glycine glycyltransferase FemX n=1 Tax=Ruania albidiflava TaxID=366586 RepID=UPI0023EF57CD
MIPTPGPPSSQAPTSGPPATAPGPLRLAPIDARTHHAFAQAASASFLQCPAWARVKVGWRPQPLGWFDTADELVGTALVLHRPIPGLPWTLAYLPEGPVLDWTDPDLSRWLNPLVAAVRSAGAFAVRMGPPVTVRRWQAATAKAGLADPAVHRLGDLAPDDAPQTGATVAGWLRSHGWIPPAPTDGFGAGQPRYVVQVPLAGRTEQQLWDGLNQLWRRNVRRAERAGVVVTRGGAEDLAAFHDLYVHTAARDGFTPRPASYFTGMWQELTAEDPDRIWLYLARSSGDLVAATTLVRVGRHVWYSYGASSTVHREVRGSNAIQWRMVRDARAAG